MGAVVALLNQKGGVGKTTVTLGLASAARAAGHRVLVVDLDPQANATWVLGHEPDDLAVTTAELLTDPSADASAAVIPSAWGPGVDLLGAHRRLVACEAELAPDRLGALRAALAPLRDAYDVVLVDCAPSIGRVTTAGLVAADLALVVVEPAALSLRGIEAVADTIEDVWEQLNPELDLAGVVLNRVPAVSAEAERRIAELATVVGKRAIWQPSIPARVLVSQSHSERLPLHAYGSKAAELTGAFDQLYRKLRRRARGRG